MTTKRHRWQLLALAALAVLVAAGGASAATPVKKKPVVPAAPKPLNVFVAAASSLQEAFPAIDPTENYSFAGSNAIAFQITNGAPIDVFAAANTTIPAALYAQGLVDKPVNFTRNTLVIVVPKSNPAAIDDIYDLTKPGVKIVVGNPAVPVGTYTLGILKNMNLTSRVLANVVSQEGDVRSVLTKVTLGQADAAFVYATDAKTVPGQVKVIKVPAWAQPKVTYAIAVVSKSQHKAAAQEFIQQVLSKDGQAKLQALGFLPLANPSPTGALFQQ
jgi:molybdate transport system substrate-binding protein